MPAAGAHQPTFFSLRGPAKALHQRAREARELSLVNEKWSFNFGLVIQQKQLAKNLYCADGRMDGRMDGWTDGRMDGDQKCPSIFLILMYVKDHAYMYLYMNSKVVTKILMGFKNWFQAWEWGSWISKIQ